MEAAKGKDDPVVPKYALPPFPSPHPDFVFYRGIFADYSGGG
jgi:hypothetical protein